ncbi:MAG TPA: glycoside hydrolase domain-containing protein [Planctomycetota bacterium]|nr:glycoside hydrolase domain-containing protein [Planctomycetota bacterium]
MPRCPLLLPSLVCLLAAAAPGGEEKNLIEDPSFELTKEKDRWGLVFQKWGGWKYEGECEFRIGTVAHTGKHSCLLFGGAAPKIRNRQEHELEPGRYQITAYIRGLDIGTGIWNMTTELMFNDKYIQLAKNGTFGWTKLTYVGEVKEKKKIAVSFGLMAPGYLWVDDVSLVKVGDNVPLTEKPVLGEEEKPIAPPGELGAGVVRCVECGYHNMPEWKTCYACGTPLEAKKAVVAGPPLKLITSFEDKNPFPGSATVEEHATDGTKAMRIDKSYVCMDGPQDWTGYDFLKADLYTDSPDPLELYIEVRDQQTTDYWTRVNYTTVAPPGASTLIIPVKQLYVGEKSRPGRMLVLNAITRLVFSIGDKPPAPLFVDNVRLERDDAPQKAVFDGLWAFDFGTGTSPVMDGFTAITPATLYSQGRGYGLKNARIWRSFDVLQPEPLYQDFICIEGGGLAVDVPNGKYRVWVNMDNPSGFWGEYQAYPKRAILAEGQPVVTDTMDFAAFRKKYFRFWNVEDLPADNTFDKYQKAYYQEKSFEADVADGQLNVEFQGANWACSVAAVVVFPVAKAAEGESFLKFVEARRRFYFDNYFKRVLHRPTGDPVQPKADDAKRGYVTFTRDIMREVYYNDTPLAAEVGKPLAAEAFAGELESLTLGIVPLTNLGKVAVAASDLAGPGGTIPASAVEVGHVSYRVSRVTMEGSVYTIKPRLIMPSATVETPKGIARLFWLMVKTPADAKPGLYKGTITIKPEKRQAAQLYIQLHVRAGTLDPVDIPAGPWGYQIGVPWPGGDAEAAAFNADLCLKSLRRMREYGFTIFSGAPAIAYKGFKDGQPVLDFSHADEQMKTAKDLGFLAVCTYGGGVQGFNAYYQDANAMKAAGFKDYSAFVKAVYSAIQKHADEQGWLPVYYNLGDEPIGDAILRATENAEAYTRAFRQGPPFFTFATSYSGGKTDDPHYRLSKALHVPNWNLHDEAGVALMHEAGRDWAFYNGGNRWTYGDYMFKAARQFGMKFRISWHWNCAAGDPYYALDCREDDYAWCTATPEGQLVSTVFFEQLREGLDDYRRLLTLARLVKEKAGTPAAQAGEKLIADRMAAFKLGARDHDRLFGPDDWAAFRRKADDAIEALRK